MNSAVQEYREWVADSNAQGDWFVMSNTYTGSSRRVDVAAVCSGNGYGEREAKLLAASNELLAALHNILVGMEASGGWVGDDGLFYAGMAAYKKATAP